jgi:hypothetical protein
VLIPALDLSIGQVMWALNAGAAPPRRMRDDLNYLVKLGVPFSAKERRLGRGNRLRYQYEHLVEAGLGLYALRHRMRPADVRSVLVTHRAALRALYRRALAEQPEAALAAEWVKSRGRVRPVLGAELFLRLHDRFAEAPGTFEAPDRAQLSLPASGPEAFDLVEYFAGGTQRDLVPLSRLVVEWVAWALVAPETKPGPST